MEVDPRIGTTLQGRYKILEHMAGGAMGVVYRAERVELGRQVAIKFLHPMFAATPDLVKRFEREARLMSRLDHPHCVSVIDVGFADGPFIVMDFVTGTTLLQLLESGPLPPQRAVGIVLQILAGLAHAHERGIIHRDIKPANVMLTNPTGTGDHARILDFGLARLTDVDQTGSTAGIVAGTPSYMSPEQARGKPLDGRTDLYSTGVLFYQLLTAEKPFESDQALELLRMHLEEPPPPLSKFRDGLDAYQPFVDRALAKSPDDRFQTADEMAHALRGRPVARAVARVRSSGWGGWVVLLLLLAGAGGTVYYVATRKAKPAATKKEPPPVVNSVADAEKLAAGGKRDASITGLHELRRRTPDDARISHLLGRLYGEKGWLPESLAAYREALDKHPAYRTDAKLIDGVIDALGHPGQEKLAAATLRAIGKPAIPRLRAAAAKHESASVRAAAGRVLASGHGEPQR